MNIEEAKKKLLEPQKIPLVEIIRKFKREGIENFVITRPEIIETLLTAYEKEKETSHYIQSQLDIANAKLVEEKEKNKKLENIIDEINNTNFPIIT